MNSAIKKINFLLTKRQRKGLIILTLLLFIGMFLEIFGLGILIPGLSIVLDPEMIEKTPLIKSIRSYFSNFSDQGFIVLFLIFIIVVYFLKSLFILFLNYKQYKFLSNLIANIINNLFSGYLIQPYRFHINRNASELYKNIHVETNYLNIFLSSLITIFIEGGFVFSVLLALIYIEPFGAIFIFIFYGLLTLMFLKFTKKRLKAWGRIREEVDLQISKIALEGLGGIKDLLILGRANYFINYFSNINYKRARLNANQGTLSQIPRLYLELISVLGIISFIIILLLQGKDTTGLIAILGLFVAATFRIIPSLNRIIGAVQSLKYYMPSVDIIYKEISLKSQIKVSENLQKNFKFSNKIELRKVNFNFINRTPVLMDINLEIKKSQIIGIVGESGSGKSTLIDLIIGLHKPTTGKILIDGVSDYQNIQSWKNEIGYVSQSIYLTDDTIENNIALGIPNDKVDKIRISEVLKLVQLDRFINKLDLGIHTKVGERGVQLSGGQRQRIGIARAIYHDPSILILDEATSALDSKTENEVLKSINNFKGEKTIIMIAHRLSTLKDCDLIYEMKNNKLHLVKL